jgi:hypothetical protein
MRRDGARAGLAALPPCVQKTARGSAHTAADRYTPQYFVLLLVQRRLAKAFCLLPASHLCARAATQRLRRSGRRASPSKQAMLAVPRERDKYGKGFTSIYQREAPNQGAVHWNASARTTFREAATRAKASVLRQACCTPKRLGTHRVVLMVGDSQVSQQRTRTAFDYYTSAHGSGAPCMMFMQCMSTAPGCVRAPLPPRKAAASAQ